MIIDANMANIVGIFHVKVAYGQRIRPYINFRTSYMHDF